MVAFAKARHVLFQKACGPVYHQQRSVKQSMDNPIPSFVYYNISKVSTVYSMQCLTSPPEQLHALHLEVFPVEDHITSMKQTMRERISRNTRRPVPIWTGLPQALRLKSMKHRALAYRWHLRVFPVHYCYLSSIGIHTYLDVLRSLGQESDKSGTEKDTNRANGIIKHPRT